MTFRPSCLAVLVTMAFCHDAFAGGSPPPFYRVFRGVRLASVPGDVFTRVLGEKFIPAAPQTHAKNGLVGYVPALPPKGAPAGTPDEIAIVIYESEEVYNLARNTPEGKAYADLHWQFFDKERTKSGAARPFGRELAADSPADILGCGLDWQAGHTMVYIGQRRPSISRERFLLEITNHVARARDAFKPQGLDGYIVSATEDQEIAFQHWKRKEQMERALASEDGKAVAADAARIFENVMWAEAAPFAGAIDYGQAVNVRFERRPRPGPAPAR